MKVALPCNTCISIFEVAVEKVPQHGVQPIVTHCAHAAAAISGLIVDGELRAWSVFAAATKDDALRRIGAAVDTAALAEQALSALPKIAPADMN